MLWGIPDPVWNAIIGGIVTIILTWMNRNNTKTLKEVKENVQTIEKATNSMKDQLVSATDRAAEARGQGMERDRSRIENAAIQTGLAEQERLAEKTAVEVRAVVEQVAAEAVEKVVGTTGKAVSEVKEIIEKVAKKNES